jgi:tyrosine-protein phosphatase SIW14
MHKNALLHRSAPIALAALVLVGPLQLAAREGQAAPAGVDRFHRVDDRLFRGAQPTPAGLKSLWDAGVRTVISLRDDDDIGYDERAAAEALGMRWVNVPIKDGTFFTQSRRIPEEAITAFFAAVDAAGPGPVFVHCRRGTDRTGAIVAFYRIGRQGWDREKAAKEARDVGMRSWYRGLQQQIKEFTAPASAARPAGQ